MKKKTNSFLNELNKLKKNNFLCIINIRFIFISENKKLLIAKIPINKKILNPFGYLHGGVTNSLSETVGCSLSFINIKSEKNYKKFNIFNIEISTNHVHHIKNGILFAKAEILHKGKTIHLVKVKVFNEKKILISFCKMTNLVLYKN
ncbi:PaaI family thioesterase [Blattabacterium cuenoti]|uniref:PaaI family thioesterase n=1 Tax=Blattabacterium cuenoti TaxID=1653831 RepID=UPI00163D2B2B|nr:hotdog fold thioesterase [Blattabacterium cuenoti]